MATNAGDKNNSDSTILKLKNIELNTLRCKRDYLNKAIDKVVDLSKAVSSKKSVVTRQDDQNLHKFLAQYSELSHVRDEFQATVMSMIGLEMEIDPLKVPSTEILDDFDDKYYQCKVVAQSIQDAKMIGQEPGRPNVVHNDTIKPALPKLTLFQFDGQIENWPTFYDTFKSLVHNRNFDDIDKFHYLLSCVKGSALNIVKNLPVTSANYPLVWQNLVEKYQDERSLTGRYLDKMLGFTPLTTDSVSNLTLFIETFDHSMKAIKALDISNLEDYLFCHLALRGLDIHTRKLFEESRDQTVLPTFRELVNHVNKQIKVLEHTFPAASSGASNSQTSTAQARTASNSKSQTPNVGNNNNSVRSQSIKTALAATKNNSVNYKLACAHCSQDHMIYRCEQFRKLPVQDRIDRVNSLKLCVNCLKSNHEVKDCKSTLSCGVCACPHHYLVHREQRPTPVELVRASAAPPSSTGSGEQRASRSPPQQTLYTSHSVSELARPPVDFHSVNGKAGGNYGVILGTARVDVTDVSGQSQNCRAVLDSGAQSSFITAACAQRLGVSRTNCPFTVSGLGGEVVKNYGMINCTIVPRNSDVPISVDMVVVAKVASDMPNVAFSQSAIDSYEPYDLADPLFYKCSHIDMLLGNDIVSDLIKDKPLSVKSDIPNVIETAFGFIVSGKLYSENQTRSQNVQLSVSGEQALDKTLRDFKEIEELPCKPQIKPLDQLSEDGGERFTSAALVLKEGIYRDEIIWSCETFSQACNLQDELINILKGGGLNLKKWSSNKAELLERVPADHRECPVTFLNDDKDVTIKVLGLRWASLYDNFYFAVNKSDDVTTKRSVQKILASIFDPVGFISPCTFVAKCNMQDIWKLGMGWDEQLPSEVCDRWLAYIAELPLLSELQVERHALLPGQTKCELVVFCDASSRGYAACIYVISRDDDGNVKVRLLISKAKVAPVKPITIPRLELMGAALLAKLLKYVKTMLTRVHVTKVTALTDSTIVLAWLQTEAYKLQTFVSNRVAQILEVILPHSWRHVSSENNMADVCSRGATPSQLIQQSQAWLQGPEWLYAPQSQWPVTTVYNKADTEITELKSNENTNLVANTNSIDETAIEFCERVFAQFSSFTKLQQIIARIQRLFRREKRDHSEDTQTILTTAELRNAHNTIIQVVQNAYFDQEIKMLSNGTDYIPSLLSPFVDAHGFLRVGGRLTHADLPYNAKQPFLLPKKSSLTRLLTDHFHKKYLHAGLRTLHNILIQNYWILSARSMIRSSLPANDNPNEFNVLTAAHFLVGRNLNAVPEYNLDEVPLNRLSRWQYLQNCTQLFWKRWSQEYLNTLQKRTKLFKSAPNLNVGDLVLVKVHQTSSNRWPLVIVEKLHPGSDGTVRVVTIRTEKSTYQRPVNKLSPLPYTD